MWEGAKGEAAQVGLLTQQASRIPHSGHYALFPSPPPPPNLVAWRVETPLPSSLLCGGPLFPHACFPCSLPQNLVALIPLALLLGDITEDLAEHFGDVVGGLLNATFGNVRRLSQSNAAA